MANTYHVKIGEIEFSLEGDSDYIERERSVFFGNVLPQAVDAMSRTSYSSAPIPLGNNISDFPVLEMTPQNISDNDLSKLSLIEFLNTKEPSTQFEIALCVAYYELYKNDMENFSSEDVKKFFQSARKSAPSNPSQVVSELLKKGYITPSIDSPNRHIITGTGLKYVEELKPQTAKEKKSPSKTKKIRTKIESQYSSLCADDFNLKNYPELKEFKKFIEKMMLTLYIVTNEKKGEWFSTADVMYIMTDILGESATDNQVKGVFKDNRKWFKVENVEGSNKGVKRRLLTAGIEYAKALIKD